MMFLMFFTMNFLQIHLEQVNSSDNFDLDDFSLSNDLNKGRRSCIQQPLSNFVLYSTLSSLCTFVSTLSSKVILGSVLQALSQSNWKAAIEEEMRALKKNSEISS